MRPESRPARVSCTRTQPISARASSTVGSSKKPRRMASGACAAALLLEDQEVVEAAQEEVALGRGLVEVRLLELAVPAHHRDVVHGPEALGQHAVERRADADEAALLLEAVGAVDRQEAPVAQYAL